MFHISSEVEKLSSRGFFIFDYGIPSSMTTNVWSRLKAERKKGRKEDELRRQPAGASTLEEEHLD